jgi:DNA polymerase-1
LTASATLPTSGPVSAEGRRRLVLVDGHGLAFRAYHALPPTLSNSAGEPTNATFGFTSMLLDVLRAHRPDCVLITFDTGRTFRHDAYQDYKAHRAPMPEDLPRQIDRIREVIAALNIPIYEAEGFEADDVIGTLAHQAAEHGLDALIVTGDSDLLQLVDEHIYAILPGAQRFGEYRMFDRAAVVERYGFEPERLPEYKALVGDKSDNIPGVPGIGEKTAKALIERFASLEDIFDNVDEITPTRAKNAIAENRAIAFQSRELATIVENVPVALEVDRCVVGNFDRERVLDLFRELEFRSLAAKLPESTREPEPTTRPQSTQLAAPVLIVDEQALMAMVDDIAAADAIAIDVETDGTNPVQSNLVGIAIATAADRAYYVPVAYEGGGILDPDTVRAKLAPAVVAHPNVVAHHGKFDLAVLERHGYQGIDLKFDTMLAAYLLGESGLGLKDLTFKHLGWEMTQITELIGTGRGQITMDRVPLDAVTRYAGGDVEATLRLKPIVDEDLREREQLDLLHTIEMPLVPVLVRMEARGIAIDVEQLRELSKELEQQLAVAERAIYEAAGHEFNINSPKQLATVLFEELKLQSGRRNKTGLSVGQEVLDGLRGAHPVVDHILEFRTLSKLKSTYVDSLPQQVNPRTGRVHTTFNQTIASTGRLSSIDPNLQNIPVRTAVGRKVRRAFVADNRPEHRIAEGEIVFVSADYSQMELRIMAHCSQDPALVSAFQHGIDVHRATAAEVFGVPIEQVTSDQRSTAKTVNFGIMYGMGAYGLSRDTGLPRAEAAKFVERYMERFQGVRAYLDETLRGAVRNGYVSSLYGRRRYVPDITASGPRRQAAERAAINMPLQGTAADIMKLAMIEVDRRLLDSDLKAQMLLQVHDELLFEAPVSELQALRELVVDAMMGVAKLSVPLEVETSYGHNWEEMTDFS